MQAKCRHRRDSAAASTSSTLERLLVLPLIITAVFTATNMIDDKNLSCFLFYSKFETNLRYHVLSLVRREFCIYTANINTKMLNPFTNSCPVNATPALPRRANIASQPQRPAPASPSGEKIREPAEWSREINRYPARTPVGWFKARVAWSNHGKRTGTASTKAVVANGASEAPGPDNPYRKLLLFRDSYCSICK